MDLFTYQGAKNSTKAYLCPLTTVSKLSGVRSTTAAEAERASTAQTKSAHRIFFILSPTGEKHRKAKIGGADSARLSTFRCLEHFGGSHQGQKEKKLRQGTCIASPSYSLLWPPLRHVALCLVSTALY